MILTIVEGCGPSKMDLMFSLFDNLHPDRAVEFMVNEEIIRLPRHKEMPEMENVCDAIIVGLERFNLSDYKHEWWKLKGRLDGVSRFKTSEGKFERINPAVEGEYDSRQRIGKLCVEV